LVPVDDSIFDGSYLVLVPHPEMGITVIFVPQYSNIQSQFFIYPQHGEALIDAISKMKEKYSI
jgi:hypothetical protein